MLTKHFFCIRTLAFIALASLLGCGIFNPEESKKSQTVSINPKLKQLLYWGFADGRNTEPNVGLSSSTDIRYPLWVMESRLYCYTVQLKNSTPVKGVFSVNLTHFDFQSHTANEFPYAIWSLGFDSDRKKIFALIRPTASYSKRHILPWQMAKFSLTKRLSVRPGALPA